MGVKFRKGFVEGIDARNAKKPGGISGKEKAKVKKEPAKKAQRSPPPKRDKQ